MKVAIHCLAVLAGVLTSAPVAMRLPEPAGNARPVVSCEPGARGCGPPERRVEEAPRARPDLHPCGWVETCQLPCDGDGRECCHADWDCPPDANLPRC